MARYGEGSIYQTAEGYRGAVTLSDGKRRYVRATTKADVRRKLEALRRQDDDGLPIGDQTITVGEYLDRWLTDVAPARSRVKSSNTLDQYAWAISNHLSPTLGHHKLRSLSADHVEAMLRQKATDGLGHGSITRLRAVLVLALTHAERRDLVARNVARLAEMPADATPPAEGRSLTVEQAQALLAAAEGDRLEALYITGLMLGLRPGELLGLRWDDVDLDAGTVQIRQTLKRETGKPLYLGEPKTPKSRRALDIPAPVAEALARHKSTQAAERLAAGPAWDQSWGLVFCAATGGPIDPSNLRRSLSRLTKAAGLGHWHPHELRHSAASLLSAAGVPLEHIADILGHDGTRMTAQVYRHATTPTVNAAVAPMEQLFGA